MQVKAARTSGDLKCVWRAHGGRPPFWRYCPARRSLAGHAHRHRRFTAAFDTVVTAAGLRIIKTPVRAPPGERDRGARWISSARRECLDPMLITGERHLRRS